jgi:2-O-(6-phospho-alpha-D-mannosyl)-D-glycerate hydrolase
MAPRRVDIVPHTHWDREWYLPFERFRLRLVELLDELLPRLEADPSYAHFMLDGQMAVVDDYCALRPARAGVLRRLVAAGRLSIGPWYTLPDEFLVSGETLVRNLQLGLDRAASFGGAMTLGYLPDMFGHVAQMPQILRQFGFAHAVVWRGVPASITRTAFRWRALDGSEVRAEYLPTGYGNGASCPEDAKALVARIRAWTDENAALLAGDAVLWMNGSDHTIPQPHLGRIVAEANQIADGEFVLRVGSLADHLSSAPADGLPEHDGELRSGARANVLMGVASNRIDVRVAAARAERVLEQMAEPLCALFLPADAWPRAELETAWLSVVRNAAHDSVCACSGDEVCDAVLHRYHEAVQIGEALVERVLRHIPGDGPVIVNPSARARGGVVTVVVPGDAVPEGTQLVERMPGDEPMWEVAASDAATVVHEVAAWHEGGYEVRRRDGEVDVVLRPGPVSAGDDDVLAGATGTVRVFRRRSPAVRVLARVDDVPGFGWCPWSTRAAVPVTVDGGRLSNGLVTVTVDLTTGTFALDAHAGLGRLVDGGDAGDTYNWCPPLDDTEIDRPTEVTVTVGDPGPVRASLRVDATYEWPVASTPERRSDERRPTVVTTTLTLDAGERFARVAVAVDNQCRDHRLRAWFPLPVPAAVSRADTAFGIVTRGLVAEGGPTEQPLATYPAGRFVQAGGLTVAFDRLLEYELVDIRDGAAHTIALTLLRATGMLSRGPMTTRPLPAGPEIELQGSQVKGRHTIKYVVATGDVDPFALAEDGFVPLLFGVGARSPSASTSAWEVTGAQVSSVRRGGGCLEVRVFNPGDTVTTVGLGGRRGWLVDLRGRPVEPVDGAFELRPWALATIAFTADTEPAAPRREAHASTTPDRAPST